MIKYSLEVKDEETEEVIHSDWAYSLEALEEKLYKAERAVKTFEEAQVEDQGEAWVEKVTK